MLDRHKSSEEWHLGLLLARARHTRVPNLLGSGKVHKVELALNLHPVLGRARDLQLHRNDAPPNISTTRSGTTIMLAQLPEMIVGRSEL